jgi:hypothetical protein
MKTEFDLPKGHINSVAEIASQDAKMIALHWTPLMIGLSCAPFNFVSPYEGYGW